MQSLSVIRTGLLTPLCILHITIGRIDLPGNLEMLGGHYKTTAGQRLSAARSMVLQDLKLLSVPSSKRKNWCLVVHNNATALLVAIGRNGTCKNIIEFVLILKSVPFNLST